MRVRLYFEPRDLWIGCFWDRVYHHPFIPQGRPRRSVVMYFCLVPTIVLRVTL